MKPKIKAWRGTTLQAKQRLSWRTLGLCHSERSEESARQPFSTSLVANIAFHSASQTDSRLTLNQPSLSTPKGGLTTLLPKSIIPMHNNIPKALTGTSTRVAGSPEREGAAESLPTQSAENHPVAVSLKV